MSRKLSNYTTQRRHMNQTEAFTQSNNDTNYAELINSINISLPAMDDFIPKSPTICNYFYEEQTEIDDKLLYDTQQQEPVIRQLLLWKIIKKTPKICLPLSLLRVIFSEAHSHDL